MASKHENDNGLIAARKPTRRDTISNAPELTLPATHGQQLSADCYHDLHRARICYRDYWKRCFTWTTRLRSWSTGMCQEKDDGEEKTHCEENTIRPRNRSSLLILGLRRAAKKRKP